MIKRYTRSSSDTAAVTEAAADEKNIWVHLEAPTEAEVNEVVAQYGLTPGHITDALDEDEVPRLETEGRQTYIYVRYALKQRDGEFDTYPLLIIMLDSALVTVSSHHVSAFDRLVDGTVSFTTADQRQLVLLMVHQITLQYDRLINTTSRKIKAVRQRLRTHAVTNQDFVDFVTIEDELNEFLSALSPNNAVLRRLFVGHRLDLDDKDLAEDVMLLNDQALAKCNSNIHSIVGVRDAHSSISDSSLNQTMKVLTVATMAMAIPNMIFGVYSMNVETPFQHNHEAFWIILGLTAVVLAIAMWAGHKKGIF